MPLEGQTAKVPDGSAGDVLSCLETNDLSQLMLQHGMFSFTGTRGRNAALVPLLIHHRVHKSCLKLKGNRHPVASRLFYGSEV